MGMWGCQIQYTMAAVEVSGCDGTCCTLSDVVLKLVHYGHFCYYGHILLSWPCNVFHWGRSSQLEEADLDLLWAVSSRGKDGNVCRGTASCSSSSK